MEDGGEYCLSEEEDKKYADLYKTLRICNDMHSFGFTYDDDGDPLISDCQTRNFADYYLTKQSIASFGRFYENKDEVLDRFLGFWDRVSARFANNPYVVGYDPMNEPPPANPLEDIHLFGPGYMDKTYLTSIYSDIFKRIDSHDIK